MLVPSDPPIQETSIWKDLDTDVDSLQTVETKYMPHTLLHHIDEV